MKKIIVSLVLALTIVSATAQQINIAAAANLRYVMQEIKTDYLKTHPDLILNISYASSGTLVQQIINGAAFDFFLSADNVYPLKLKAKGLTSGPMSTYAYGKLALYSTSIDVQKIGLKALKAANVQKIAVANPLTAPYGARSLELLKSQGLYKELKSKIVIAENISAAAQYAFTSNTELGFIAYSFAMAPDMVGKGHSYIIPQKLYTPIEQACILLKKGASNPAAIQFKKYVLSAATKPIWEKYGYGVPEK